MTFRFRVRALPFVWAGSSAVGPFRTSNAREVSSGVPTDATNADRRTPIDSLQAGICSLQRNRSARFRFLTHSGAGTASVGGLNIGNLCHAGAGAVSENPKSVQKLSMPGPGPENTRKPPCCSCWGGAGRPPWLASSGGGAGGISSWLAPSGGWGGGSGGGSSPLCISGADGSR
jgi:hypothetical protein